MAQMEHRFPTVFEHEQVDESDTWVIVHNLHSYPVVDIYIDFAGEKHRILPLTVTYNNPETVTVTFSVPRTGLATVV